MYVFTALVSNILTKLEESVSCKLTNGAIFHCTLQQIQLHCKYCNRQPKCIKIRDWRWDSYIVLNCSYIVKPYLTYSIEKSCVSKPSHSNSSTFKFIFGSGWVKKLSKIQPNLCGRYEGGYFNLLLKISAKYWQTLFLKCKNINFVFVLRSLFNLNVSRDIESMEFGLVWVSLLVGLADGVGRGKDQSGDSPRPSARLTRRRQTKPPRGDRPV
jgi:hypothetical protein